MLKSDSLLDGSIQGSVNAQCGMESHNTCHKPMTQKSKTKLLCAPLKATEQGVQISTPPSHKKHNFQATHFWQMLPIQLTQSQIFETCSFTIFNQSQLFNSSVEFFYCCFVFCNDCSLLLVQADIVLCLYEICLCNIAALSCNCCSHYEKHHCSHDHVSDTQHDTQSARTSRETSQYETATVVMFCTFTNL